jgi:AcrR family transcriptional regulator
MARPRTDIQPRIVHAARARFLAEGVDGASLRTIARDAKTNIGMVFYYFPTKDDLFLAVVEEVYANLLRDLEAALGGGDSARERLKRGFTRLGAATDDEIQVVRLVAREALLSSERFERVFTRAQAGHVRMIFEVLAEGAAKGEIDADLPLPFALVCTFAMGGIPQLLRRVGGDRLPFAALPRGEALAEMSVDLLFRAIGRRAEKSEKSEKSEKHEPSKKAEKRGKRGEGA